MVLLLPPTIIGSHSCRRATPHNLNLTFMYLFSLRVSELIVPILLSFLVIQFSIAFPLFILPFLKFVGFLLFFWTHFRVLLGILRIN